MQREADGRGGSALLHEHAQVGATLGFGGPRNNFRLAPALDHLFIAGGIGITPILPMIRQADLLDLPWRLLYLGRSRARLAYLDELAAYGERVTVHCADEVGRAELDAWRPTDPRRAGVRLRPGAAAGCRAGLARAARRLPRQGRAVHRGRVRRRRRRRARSRSSPRAPARR